MNWPTFVGLIFVTAGSTIFGSLPVLYHHYFKESGWNWWESFGGGVMVSASLFSLYLPAYRLIQKEQSSFAPMVYGIIGGFFFIFLLTNLIRVLTQNIHHQRAFLFVAAMAIHNIPEGMSVGVDVAALGWKDSLPLTIAIFIQNLPEGLASSMSFIVAGFTLKESLLANGVTAIVEGLSALVGFHFVTKTVLGLPLLLSFAGTSMVSVVAKEALNKSRNGEAASISYSGFAAGLSICGLLDLLL